MSKPTTPANRKLHNRVKGEKIVIALFAVMILAALPSIHAQPICGASVTNDADNAACPMNTFQLVVSGPGILNWLGTYQGSVYTSGSTSESITISVPQGTVLTFTATPGSGDSLASLSVDQSAQQTNPYVSDTLTLTAPSYHTVIADFGQNSVATPAVQYLFANPPLQSPQPRVLNLGIAGSGEVYWSSSYEGSTYGSGWVDSSSSITIPKDHMITFTAVPASGHVFTNWVINGYDQGSENPFIMFGTGQSSDVNVVASFDQTFYANPPVLSPALENSSFQNETVQIGIQGSGILYWSSSYGGSNLASGFTDSTTSIVVPRGATVSFVAVPTAGSNFESWIIDSVNQGSNNPYITTSVGGFDTVVTVFN